MTEPACARVDGRLSALLDGALAPRERAAVSAHLSGCASCRTELESLRVTRTLLRGAPVRTLPPGLAVASALAAVPSSGDGSGAASDDTATDPAHDPLSSRRRVTRAAAAALALTGLVGATAFAVGDDQPATPRSQQVAVPLDVFVADHLVRTTGRPVSIPVVLEVGR